MAEIVASEFELLDEEPLAAFAEPVAALALAAGLRPGCAAVGEPAAFRID